MIMDQLNIFIVPAVTFAICIILGLTGELILKRLIKSAERREWKTNAAILTSLKRIPFIACLIAGTYMILPFFNTDESVKGIILQALTLLIIVVATIVVSRMVGNLIHSFSGKIKGIFASTSIFSNITKGIILIVGFLIALQSLGISIAPILAALGVGGLAVALALQDTLSNLFSGLQIIAARQVKPGEFVKLDNGEQGYIEDITWRNTTIRTLPNNRVIIPNSKMASSIITNYSQPEEALTVNAEISISYENDLERVEETAMKVAEDVVKTVRGAIREHKPTVRYNLFNDAAIKINVSLQVEKFANQFLIKHELLKRIHKKFREEEISIMTPTKPVQIVNS
jgi:small-conductance mechanosensitive channel